MMYPVAPTGFSTGFHVRVETARGVTNLPRGFRKESGHGAAGLENGARVADDIVRRAWSENRREQLRWRAEHISLRLKRAPLLQNVLADEHRR